MDKTNWGLLSEGGANVRLPQNCLAGFVAETLSVDVTIPYQPGTMSLMSVFGWIIIHQNLGDNFSWLRAWANYKHGFGSIEGNFWLGLEKMSLLTSAQAYRLRSRSK